LPQHVIVFFHGEADIPVSVKGEIQRQLFANRMEDTLAWLLSGMEPPEESQQKAALWLDQNLPNKVAATDSLSLSKGATSPKDVERGYLYFVLILCVGFKHTYDMASHFLGEDAKFIFTVTTVGSTISLQGFALYAGYQDLQQTPTLWSLAHLLVLYVAGWFLSIRPWFFHFLIAARLLFLVTERIPDDVKRARVRILLGVSTHIVSALFSDSIYGHWYKFVFPIHRAYQGGHLFIYYFSFSYLLESRHEWLSGSKVARICSAVTLPMIIYYFRNFHYPKDPSVCGYSSSEFGDDFFNNLGIDFFHVFLSLVFIMFLLPWLPATPSILSDIGSRSFIIYTQCTVWVFTAFFSGLFGVADIAAYSIGAHFDDAFTVSLRSFTFLFLVLLVMGFMGMGVEPFLPSKLHGLPSTLVYVFVLFGQAYFFSMCYEKLVPESYENLVKQH